MVQIWVGIFVSLLSSHARDGSKPTGGRDCRQVRTYCTLCAEMMDRKEDADKTRQAITVATCHLSRS